MADMDVESRKPFAFARPYGADAFLAVGGGSVGESGVKIHLKANFLDFVNARLGKYSPI